jgi:hypothetical protein
MPLRELVDAEGVPWRVWDTRPGQRSVETIALPEELREGWLSFESEHAKRRFAPIPPEWEFFSESALRRILAAAVPVRKPLER